MTLANSDLIQVSINPDGSAYFMYSVKVTRGIRGKTKGKVDEFLIHGIPASALQNFCVKNNLIITNKAVYEDDMGTTPLLVKKTDSWTYVKV